MYHMFVDQTDHDRSEPKTKPELSARSFRALSEGREMGITRERPVRCVRHD